MWLKVGKVVLAAMRFQDSHAPNSEIAVLHAPLRRLGMPVTTSLAFYRSFLVLFLPSIESKQLPDIPSKTADGGNQLFQAIENVALIQSGGFIEVPLHAARICSFRTLHRMIVTKICLPVSSRVLIGQTTLAFLV